MNPIKEITGTAVPLMIDDIDTDRIIPARYLVCVTFDGIGEYAFFDERFNQDGTPKDFPLNESKYEGAEIIISAANFGCGSSREHAPQSIKRAGYKAVIAESFAEIFFGNSLTIGLPCVTMAKADIEEIASVLKKNPKTPVSISLEDMFVEFEGKHYEMKIPETARSAFVNGTYDLLAELIRNKAKIEELNNKLRLTSFA